MVSAATSSMARAFSLVKGRGMSRRERTISPATRTSKQPFRGLSGLIFTADAWPFRLDSSFRARVLNAFQVLQASITTSPLALAFGSSKAFLDDVVAGSSAASLARLTPFLGGMMAVVSRRSVCLVCLSVCLSSFAHQPL